MNITENGIRNLAESCPKLTVFKAEGCTHVRERNSILDDQEKKNYFR
jgi:hypothetical protein